ncbi:MAG: polysaccharide deacetylase family protein [Verrucomicrobia bacterium]|jgi:undecaprenyl phosphate-alpha-L-ara4FN deformylase|nr:polysaccharide deacetylase family protein [Verrucomicrobiota bacterium]MBT7698694.1 polysaccharide deacetylase family protein [Verrucomicrobiota bacterium]
MRETGRPALRVDVDFRAGMRRAVPRMAALLAQHDMQATFFLVTRLAGGRTWLRKAVRPAVLKRWLRIGAWRIAGQMGAWDALRGRGRGAAHGELLAQTCAQLWAEGHEVGVHGFDHEWWVDEVWHAPTAQLREEIGRAYDALRHATGRADVAWASPGWRTTDGVLQALVERGVPYLAECWGRTPFRTRLADGSCLDTPHLPITAPSAESMQGRSDEEIAVTIAAACTAHPCTVCCLHDYYEGVLRPGLLAALVEAFERRGLRPQTLADAARRWASPVEALPVGQVGKREVSGFVGAVSVQEGAG